MNPNVKLLVQVTQRKLEKKYHSECPQTSRKHDGGSFMGWGCISTSGIGNMVKSTVPIKIN